MRLKINLQTNNWIVSSFMKELKINKTLNLDLLSRHINVWPYDKTTIINWSKPLNILRIRLSELQSEYFQDIIQIKKISEQDKKELIIILRFTETLCENTSGRSHISIVDFLLHFIFAVDYDVAYHSLRLLKLLSNKYFRTLMSSKQITKFNNIFVVFDVQPDILEYRIRDIVFNFENDDIFEFNKKLLKKDEAEYVKMLFIYKKFLYKENLLNIKYLTGSIFIFNRSLELNINEKLKDILLEALEKLKNTDDGILKGNIFVFLVSCIERRFKSKFILDYLRIKTHNGFVMKELETILYQDNWYVNALFYFISTCLNLKGDIIISMIEVGLISVFKEYLSMKIQNDNHLLLTTKINITKMFINLFNMQTPIINGILIESNVLGLINDEIIKNTALIPTSNYINDIKNKTIFNEKTRFLTLKYNNLLLKGLEVFYNHRIDNDIIIPDIFEGKFNIIIEKMLTNYNSYPITSIGFVLDIIITYINTYPLNIIILQEKNLLPVIFDIYENIPNDINVIILLVDLINGLTLKSEFIDLIIERELITKVLNTIVDKEKYECFAYNDSASHIGAVVEELIRHHPRYKKIVYEHSKELLKNLNNYYEDDKKVIYQILKSYFEENAKPSELDFTLKYCPFQEIVRSLLLFFEALLTFDNFDKNEINDMILLMLNLFEKPYFLCDTEDDVIELYFSTLVKGNKNQVGAKIYESLLDKIIALFNNIKNINYINKQLCELKGMINDKNTENKMNLDTLEKEYNSIIQIQIINRLMLLLSELGHKKLHIQKDSSIYEKLFCIFEKSHFVFKIIIKKQDILFFKQLDQFTYGYMRDELVNEYVAKKDITNKITYMIYLLHLTSLDLIKDAWKDIFLLEEPHYKKFIKLMFGTLKLNENQTIANHKYLFSSEEYPIQGSVTNLHNIQESGLYAHLIDGFFIIVFLNSIVENELTYYFKNEIYILFDLLSNIIKCFKNTDADECLQATKENVKTTKKSHPSFYRKKETLRIIINVVENVFSLILSIYDHSSFVIEDICKSMILMSIIESYQYIHSKKLYTLYYQLLKWMVKDKKSGHITFNEYLNISDEKLGIAKIYLNSLVKSGEIDKLFSVNNKEYLNYLMDLSILINNEDKNAIAAVKSLLTLKITDQNDINYFNTLAVNSIDKDVIENRYNIIRDMQKRSKNAFYAILHHNQKFLISLLTYPNPVLAEIVITNLLTYTLLKPCTCQNDANIVIKKIEENKQLIVSDRNINTENVFHNFRLQENLFDNFELFYKSIDDQMQNRDESSLNNELVGCVAHYSEDLIKVISMMAKFDEDKDISENLKFILGIVKIIEYKNLKITKGQILSMIDFKRLFNSKGTTMYSIYAHLLNLLVFHFIEDEAFIKLVIRKEIDTASLGTKNVLYFRHTRVYTDEVNRMAEKSKVKEKKVLESVHDFYTNFELNNPAKNDNINADVSSNIKTESETAGKNIKNNSSDDSDLQKEMIYIIKKHLFYSTNATLLLQILSEILIYFPTLSESLKDKVFLQRLFKILIKTEIDKTEKHEFSKTTWVINLLCTIFLRTTNIDLKKMITDIIIKNLRSNNDKAIISMCNLMTKMFSTKIITNKYDGKDDKSSENNNTRYVRIERNPLRNRMRSSNLLSSNIGREMSENEVNDFLDELAGRINPLPEPDSNIIRVTENDILIEESLINRIRREISPNFINTSAPIIDVFIEKKIINFVLEAKKTKDTIPHLLTFLELFSKIKNTNGQDVDTDSIEIDELQSCSTSSYSSHNYDESYDDDESYYEEELEEEIKEEKNVLHEVRFLTVLERWTSEVRFLWKIQEESFVPHLRTYKTDFPELQYSTSSSEITASDEEELDLRGVTIPLNQTESSTNNILTDNANDNTLIPEQEVCTYQENCQCLDCLANSSESTVGDFEGIYPDLDPNVLNDLPEDILAEIINNYFEERRSTSVAYVPINSNFLLSLNENVRNIFEDHEVRFRNDYRIENTQKPEEEEDEDDNFEIRNSNALIDVKYIDDVLQMVYTNITNKSGLNLVNSLCGNENIRRAIIGKIISNIKENLNDKTGPVCKDSVKILYFLLRHHEDYAFYFTTDDINVIFSSVDESLLDDNYLLLIEICLLMTDYNVIKRIFINSQIKVEFTRHKHFLLPYEMYAKKLQDEGKITDAPTNNFAHCYLPDKIGLEIKKDSECINIINSNISFYLNKHIDINLLLSNIRNCQNREILESYINVMKNIYHYFTLPFINFLFGEIITIFNNIVFENDFYDDIRKVYLYFLVLNEMKIKLFSNKTSTDIDKNESDSASVESLSTALNGLRSPSLYYIDCYNLYNEYRIELEDHKIWKLFFSFIGKKRDKGFVLSYIHFFECFCILRKLRFDENEYNANIKEIEENNVNEKYYHENKINNENAKNDNSAEGIDIKNKTEKQVTKANGENNVGEEEVLSDEITNTRYYDFFMENHIKRFKPSTSFNEFFRNTVLEYKEYLNYLFENNIATVTNTFDILLHFNVLEFHNKRNYLRQIFKKTTSNTLHLNIERKNVFEDSYNQIMNKSGEDFKISKLHVKFVNEEGVDVGGLTSEFFSILSQEITNPNYCLFVLNQDGRTYSINKSSIINPEHLLFFRFVGRIIAKGIIDDVLTDIHFTIPFYKQILDKTLTLNDLETLDVNYYRSLEWMKNNSIEGVLDMKFCVEYEEFGKMKVFEFIQNGSEIAVNDSNKNEYIKYLSEFYMTKGCEKQLESFKNGFYEVIEKKYIKIFNEKELELLITGLPEIDVDDWRNNTDYYGYKNNSKEIEWFWRCVRGMNNEDRAKLLQFVTGTSKLPIEGFKGLRGNNSRQRFQIHVGGKGLPTAHTCFNQLDLPRYKSYDELVENLLYAIRECSTGFGFA